MKKTLLILFLTVCCAATLFAQTITVKGKVIAADDGYPLPGVTIKIKGGTKAVTTDINGMYTIAATPQQTLVFSYIGTTTQEKIVGSQTTINVTMAPASHSLNEVVVTSLGQTVQQRSLGTSQQSVKGADIQATQREDFINALQGRVAGVNVTQTSGVPGASTTITIRGVSSISGSNSPLFIVDGLPVDNKTLNTNALYSDLSSTTAYNNRGVDFTNRGSDINPEDIESLVVLKGPEAAALYGIDAANGAIVITTKRGKPGEGRVDYSNSFRIERTRTQPQIQSTYGLGTSGVNNVITTLNGSYEYFGPKYPDGTQLYNNVKGFFRSAFTDKQNIAFSGGSNAVNYRIASSYTNQQGVVPGSLYNRINVTGASQGIINSWLKADLSLSYDYSKNNQPLKGSIGPLLGLLDWPQTDDASNYLNPSGTRRTLNFTGLGDTEVDNPYFSTTKNINTTKNNRMIANLGLTITPTKWLTFKSNLGVDAYFTSYLLVKHPESAAGFGRNGTIDLANDATRNLQMQSYFQVSPQKIAKDLTLEGTLGNAVLDQYDQVDDGYGENFLDPNFVSLNNTNIANRSNKTTISQRRLVSFFARATLTYKDWLYLQGSIRNDRTSTIPVDAQSFYYPGASASFIFTDAFKGLQKVFSSGKLRAAFAQVGKDARPYAYQASLESKTTTGGGYGSTFYGPNPNLRPEFAQSYELGTELGFLNDRLGVDVTVYRKTTTDQIVNDIRGSYATGYILFNLNGASTRNQGIEVTLRGEPIKTTNFDWNILANFESARGKVLSLPNGIPESYVSDTWLYNNVRDGNTVGNSTQALTGLFYLRNNAGQTLISAGTGLPIRSTVFTDYGYDRTPKLSVGLTNTLTYKNWSLSFLLDFRLGGDILNATQHYLTTVGLSTLTQDRTTSRVISGVIQDGKENTTNPTINNIVVTPYYQNSYYTSISEELFIEKNINWARLRDVTLQYKLPPNFIKRQHFIKNASVFVTATDLFLITNYSGLDPSTNGNSAAVGGSGAVGIDYGNFPVPQGLNFGVKIGL